MATLSIEKESPIFLIKANVFDYEPITKKLNSQEQDAPDVGCKHYRSKTRLSDQNQEGMLCQPQE